MKISDKYTYYNKAEVQAVKNVLLSAKLSGTSDFVYEYEKKISSYFKSKYAVAVSSGTAAIQAALFATGVNNGDEVIISSTCPSMSVLPILEIGAKPIFCDTYKDNFGINIGCLKNLISDKIRAVIEVPMWGYPTRVDILKEFLTRKDTPLILDLAQAHGTKLNDHYLSHYGDISCFSTHDRKILATGEGGFVLTSNKEIYDKVKSYIQFGNMDGVNFGLNFKLSSLQACIGSNRINLIQKQISVREQNANYIRNKIKNPFINELKVINNGNPNYYFMLLQLNFRNNLAFINYLDRAGIPSDILRYNYKVLYEYPLFKKYKRSCPNSELLAKNITTLPVHPNIDKKSLDYMVSFINNYKNS